MLNENTNIPKAMTVGIGNELFVSKKVSRIYFRLDVIRKLSYALNSNWHLIYFTIREEQEINEQVLGFLKTTSIYISQVYPVLDTNERDIISLIQSCDIVYAPSVLAKLKANPRFRSPQSAADLASVVEHFATTEIPFILENYYNFLNYGS